MPTNFPSSLDSFTNPTQVGPGQFIWDDGTIRDSATPPANILVPANPALTQTRQHTDKNDAIAAIEAKLGVDNSAVTTSVDYLLKSTASTDPGHRHSRASLDAPGADMQVIYNGAGELSADSCLFFDYTQAQLFLDGTKLNLPTVYNMDGSSIFNDDYNHFGVGRGQFFEAYNQINPAESDQHFMANFIEWAHYDYSEGVFNIIANVSLPNQTLIANRVEANQISATGLFDVTRTIGFREDFLAGVDGLTNLTVAVTNSGTVTAGTGTATSPGTVVLATNASSTATACVGGCPNSPSSILLGAGQVAFTSILVVPTLSDGTNTFVVRSGLQDSASGDGTDGVFFRYAHSVNSGRWELVCRSNGTESTRDTGITVVAGTRYMLMLKVNATATSAQAFINGATVGTPLTTNIPTGAGRETGVNGCSIVKSAGTTNRTVVLDAVSLAIDLTAPRY